jgi:hypothetical protein
MQLTASGTNNTVQGMNIIQDNGTYKTKTVVTINPTANTTTVAIYTTPNMTSTTWTQQTTGGYPMTITGTTNGVVYVNGNVGTPSVPPAGNIDGTPTTFGSGGLWGVVANNVMNSGGTAATSTNALSIVTNENNSLNISGDVIYSADSMSSGATTAKTGTLGIVSSKVQILENLEGDSAGDGLANVTVDATVLAYNTFDAEDPLNRAIAAFNLLGGYIVTNSGTFAGIDSSGTQWTGFTVNRNYDSRVANAPPPFFPSTGNLYKLRSYVRDNYTY